MGNSLSADLHKKVVWFKNDTMSVEASEHPFLVEDGFGASPHTSGSAIVGTFLSDGEHTRLDGWMVDRIATDEEIATFVNDHPKAREILVSKGIEEWAVKVVEKDEPGFALDLTKFLRFQASGRTTYLTLDGIDEDTLSFLVAHRISGRRYRVSITEVIEDPLGYHDDPSGGTWAARESNPPGEWGRVYGDGGPDA